MSGHGKLRIVNTKTGEFSSGKVMFNRRHDEYYVRFGRTPKEWTSEDRLKVHLVKCMTYEVDMSNWEVVRVEYTPTKPIMDWFDADMLKKVLK